MHPLISIIVPVYNTESYLRGCVDSILAQSFTDFEVLLVDDGSTDGSGRICDEYVKKDSRVKVIHKENGGVSSARNVGLEHAIGEWITFADSDDSLNPTAFEQYIIAIQDGKADIVRSGYSRCFPDGAKTDVSCVHAFDVTDKSEMIRKMESTVYYGYLWNSFYRSSKIKDIRFAEDISWCEDHLFSIQCYGKCELVRYLSSITYNYRINSAGSLSFPKDPVMIANVAEKERDAKMGLHISDVETINKIWELYYYKIFLAISLAVSCGYKVFNAFITGSERYFSQNKSFPCGKLLVLCYSSLIPCWLKYTIVYLYKRLP